MLALALGVGVWGALLLAPAPREAPPVLGSMMPQLYDTKPVAQWFGGSPLRVRVTAAGVISADDGRGAALLSVDGAPARAYRVGQTLAPGVVLDSVSASAMTIAQDGLAEHIAVPAAPGVGLRGFVTVPAAQ